MIDEDKDYVVVYDLDHYVIVINDDLDIVMSYNTYKGGYEVINRDTGVTELVTTILPEAIAAAEAWEHAMLSEPWNWRKGEKQSVPDIVLSDEPDPKLN